MLILTLNDPFSEASFCSAEELSDFYRLDLPTRTWTNLNGMVTGNLTPSARSSHGLAAIGLNLFMFGGFNGSGKLCASTIRFRITTVLHYECNC